MGWPRYSTPCRRSAMRRLFGALAVLALMFGVAFTRSERPPSAELQIKVAERNPWNHLRLNNNPADFRFAFVSDRTGGARKGVFERSVEQLNWLQPEFV